VHAAGRPVAVVLVDDHVLFREGVREILRSDPHVRVVGEAGGTAEALRTIAETQPDVVLLDVEVDGADVRQTVREIRDLAPGSSVVVVTMFDEHGLIRDLLAAGVYAFLLKSVSRFELLAAVRAAPLGADRAQVTLSRETLLQLLGGDAATAEDEAPAGPQLTPRETAVLRLVATARSNSQIARQLDLSEATVKRHLRGIFTKLGAVSRIDVINKSREAGLLEAAD
jgi:DNA-binding NarL/FixJ family response regulator